MKVLWGYEPRNQNAAAVKGMYKLISEFALKSKDIEVGYVVTENETYLHTAFDVPFEKRFNWLPKKLILDEFKKARVGISDNKIHVIHHQTLSTTKAVDRLLKLAMTKDAKLIALYTHNKKGIERFFLGSFAETAVHRSRVDLLLAGPKTKYRAKLSNVLFASDFSSGSKKDLLKVIGLCKRTGAKLTIFHAAEVIYKWSLDETNPKIHAYRRKTDRMARWIKEICERSKVPHTLIINSEFTSIPELTFKTAKKVKADLIVVGAKAGPFAALMGGSVARNIVRDGVYPVLVLKR